MLSKFTPLNQVAVDDTEEAACDGAADSSVVEESSNAGICIVIEARTEECYEACGCELLEVKLEGRYVGVAEPSWALACDYLRVSTSKM